MPRTKCPKCPSRGECLSYRIGDQYEYRFKCLECGCYEVKTKEKDVLYFQICPFCHKKHNEVIFLGASFSETRRQESSKTKKGKCPECGSVGECCYSDASDQNYRIDKYTFVGQGCNHAATRLIKGRFYKRSVSRHTYCPFCKRPSFRH